MRGDAKAIRWFLCVVTACSMTLAGCRKAPDVTEGEPLSEDEIRAALAEVGRRVSLVISLDGLDPGLARYDAVRAHLHERGGDRETAVALVMDTLLPKIAPASLSRASKSVSAGTPLHKTGANTSTFKLGIIPARVSTVFPPHP